MTNQLKIWDNKLRENFLAVPDETYCDGSIEKAKDFYRGEIHKYYSKGKSTDIVDTYEITDFLILIKILDIKYCEDKKIKSLNVLHCEAIDKLSREFRDKTGLKAHDYIVQFARQDWRIAYDQFRAINKNCSESILLDYKRIYIPKQNMSELAIYINDCYNTLGSLDYYSMMRTIKNYRDPLSHTPRSIALLRRAMFRERYNQSLN